MTYEETILNRLMSDSLKKHMAGIDARHNFSDGKLFECAFASMLQIYVDNVPVPEGKRAPTADTRRISDYLFGSDLIIDDPDCLFPGRGGKTRIDVTTNMTGKDNVPLITPAPGMQDFFPARHPTRYSKSLTDTQKGLVHLEGAAGWKLRFGIRIGNGRNGFQEPVVVAALDSTADFDRRGPIRETIAAMHAKTMKNAPAAIRMANLTLASYYYMSDPAYRARIDKAIGPERAAAGLPILVPNQRYFQGEARYVLGPDARPRMCTAAVIDSDGRSVLDRNGNTVSVYTDIPWMSKKGRMAIEAALSSPRAAKLQPESLAAAKALLEQPCREPGQKPPIVATRDGVPIMDAQLRKNALRELTRTLDRAYGADDGKAAITEEYN